MSKFKIFGYMSILLSITLLLTAGCKKPPIEEPDATNAYNPETTGEAQVRKNIQFADIPVPANFKFRKNLSKTFQGRLMRFGTLIYDGVWNVWETNQWYLNKMPEGGWKLTGSKSKGDYNIINTFKKGRETATVRAFEQGNKIRVEIKINE